jgi:15-cis-phytoene synthase
MNQAIATLVRRHDPDRFLTALFAPPEKRDALLTLYAFNHELARAREAVSEPALALIRMQWWREVVEGARRRHEVAEPLTAAIEVGDFDRADLLALIDAREIEAEPSIDASEAWRAYLMNSAGGLVVAAARMLGAPDPEALRRLGAAYGVAGLLRSIPAHARQGRCLLPGDVLAEHGLTREQVVANPIAAPIEPVIRFLARQGLALLDRPVRLPRGVVAAALPAVLARRDLRQAPAFAAYRGLGDRMAVMRAGLRGRV